MLGISTVEGLNSKRKQKMFMHALSTHTHIHQCVDYSRIKFFPRNHFSTYYSKLDQRWPKYKVNTHFVPKN